MSLAEKLKQIAEAAKERIPEETLMLMKKGTQQLRDSGMTENALQEGMSLPPFELPNIKGELASSTQLLEKGNLVLTFYRGVW